MSSVDRTSYLVLDQGGHAGRATVFDQAGRVLGRADCPVETRRGGNGRVEQDPEAVLGSLTSSIRDAVAQAGIEASQLYAAGLACQRSSVVCWQRDTGEALTPVLSWQDTRGEALFNEVLPDSAAVAARTGLPPVPHYGATKLAWCLRNEPAVRQALEAGTLRWGPLASFLLDRLLDERPYVANHTIAQRTLLFDIHAADWAGELVDAFGLPRNSLPRCVPDCSLHGHLRIGTARIPMAACAGDQNAVPFAYGTPGMGTAWLNAGTGAFLLRMLPPGETAADGLLQSLIEDRGGNRSVALEGTVNGAGAAFDWLGQQAGRDIPWDALEAMVPSAGMPLFINSVGDLGSPFWRTGVEPEFTPADAGFERRLYAVAESIAFLVRANFERMPAVDRVQLAGGLSRSEFLCRLLAAALNTRIERTLDPGMTSRGVLALLTGAPALPDGLPDGFAPDPGFTGILDARYLRWRAAMDQAIQAPAD